MEHDDVLSKAGRDGCSDASFQVEPDTASPCAQRDIHQADAEFRSDKNQAYFSTLDTLITSTDSAFIAEATQLRLRLFNSTTLSTSAVSTSTSFPVTLEYARMVLGHRFKVSHCHTLQALKLSARIKCSKYNTAATTDVTLVHNSAHSTVHELAASLAVHREAQRQQLLDLFGYVEEAEPGADETVKTRSPAIDPPFGVFIGINIRVGREFYANAGVRIHDHAPVVVGRHVRLGPNVSLLTEGHDTDAEERRKGDVFARPIEIGDDVWIGAGATVLGGVKIGNRAVVGAASLVCKDVGAGQVVVGVPARVQRTVMTGGTGQIGTGEEAEWSGVDDAVLAGVV
jgi:acetyltransferase-like isoleucine patch superfamily enzyme